MPLSNIAIIANPRAGSKNPGKLAEVVTFLNQHIPTRLIWTNHAGHATELARDLGADCDTLVAVCGGDGTIFEALNGLPPSGVLGLLPGGTANVIVRELGIPFDLREAAKVLLTGTLRHLDCGVVEGKKYLMVGGFGFDAHVAATVSPTLKKYLGQYAYHLETAWQYFQYQAPRLSIMVDGQGPYEGAFALIANMRRYGGHLFFAHSARYDDGLLDLVLFRDLGLRTLIGGAAGAFFRKGVPDRLAHRLRGRTFVISSNQDIRFQLDGEVMPAVRQTTVEVHPHAVKMIIP